MLYCVYATLVTSLDMIDMAWLLFLSQLPATPSSLRVMVWRRMRTAGAVGLQNGVWVLPVTAEHERFMQELLLTIERQGATGQIFHASPINAQVEQEILGRFRSDRAEEYDEFCEQCAGFFAEIKRETGHRKFTFAELDEAEQNLQRLVGWLAKIQARDFFVEGKAGEAVAALGSCQQAFDTFASQVYAREGMEPPLDGQPNDLQN